MSVAFAKKALQRFLSDPEPEVLCIKGNWGVGKTYAWNEAVKEAVSIKTLKLRKYAYVSLFGIKDSSDILQSVFALAENTYPSENKTVVPKNIIGYNLHEMELGKKFRSLLGFASEHVSVPHIAGLGGVARAVLSSFVGDTLVCIDDFERKGKSVTVNEIMGVIAQLRDARRCKVVLILNEDSLDEKEKEEFHRYSEKVINRAIQFKPTEAEATAIAFPGNDDLNECLRKYCENLGILNIRIMLKMLRIAKELLDLVKTTDEYVRNAILRSLVVLVWAAFSPPGEGAPSLAYLKDKRFGHFMGYDDKKVSPQETEWGVMLNDYGFSHCDELGLLMISGIEQGFFNDEKVSIEIEKLLINTAKIRGEAALTAAWAAYHDSFDDNADEVASSLYDGFLKNISYLTPLNLNGAVIILKTTGHVTQAHDLLKRYIDAHCGEDIFDLSEDVFGGYVTDPDVVAAFAEKAKEKVDNLPVPMEAATRISNGGWSLKDEESLAALSVDDFVVAFKSAKGKERRTLIFGSLEFRKISNASERQMRIAQNAKAALAKIGQESPLNARRLEAYGIKLDNPKDVKTAEGQAGGDQPLRA